MELSKTATREEVEKMAKEIKKLSKEDQTLLRGVIIGIKTKTVTRKEA